MLGEMFRKGRKLAILFCIVTEDQAKMVMDPARKAIGNQPKLEIPI
jgi:hypothetical protein